MPQQQQAPATPPAATTAEVKEPKVTLLGPAQKTFPRLLGDCVSVVLTDHGQMAAQKKAFTLWYAAQDPNKKQEIARQTRTDLEYCRSVIESMYVYFRDTCFQDLQ